MFFIKINIQKKCRFREFRVKTFKISFAVIFIRKTHKKLTNRENFIDSLKFAS